VEATFKAYIVIVIDLTIIKDTRTIRGILAIKDIIVNIKPKTDITIIKDITIIVMDIIKEAIITIIVTLISVIVTYKY
jgi:hypothetical protein